MTTDEEYYKQLEKLNNLGPDWKLYWQKEWKTYYRMWKERCPYL